MPTKRTPLPDPAFQRLKELDRVLDSTSQAVSDAQSAYRKTLQEFAVLCHELWERDKAQGSHQGKGFRNSLQAAGIKVGRAYRAMKKFFPGDFPARKAAPTSTLSGADEVSEALHQAPNSGIANNDGPCSMLRPLAQLPEALPTSSAANEVARPAPAIRFIEGTQPGKGILECSLTITAEEKAEVMAYLESVGAAQVQRLLLDALKQAAQNEPLTPEPGRKNRTNRNLNQQKKEKTTAVEEVNGGLKDDQNNGVKNHVLKNNDLKNHGLKNNDLKTNRPAARPQTTFEGYVRLSRLQESLRLNGYYAHLQELASGYPPAELQARLDWVDAHPEWCAALRGQPAQSFVNAFHQDTLPSR